MKVIGFGMFFIGLMIADRTTERLLLGAVFMAAGAALVWLS